MHYINNIIGGKLHMETFINLIVNNGVAVVVCAYFLFTNYKFNDKLVTTLARINEKLDIQEEERKRNNEDKSTGA